MLHTTENAGEDLPLRRFHCNGENRLKPYDEFGSARFGGAWRAAGEHFSALCGLHLLKFDRP